MSDMVDLGAFDALTQDEIEQLLANLTPAELDIVHQMIATAPVWLPMLGPQLMAYTSTADVVGYGGAAGGGKTDLIVGLALTVHKRCLIVRREKAQTDGIVQRMEEILGNKVGYNGQKSTWVLGDGRLVEFGGLDNLGDEKRWQGRAHDLKSLDEATEIREAQARFVLGWMRTNDPTIKPKALLTFNPPTTADGRWVVDYFAPWIKKGYPNPAAPGELRYFARINDKDVEVVDKRPFVLDDKNNQIYDFNPLMYRPEQVIEPQSRTFIPARVTDNAYYMATGYIKTLQSLPEPLRSQMLMGDFGAGIKDDDWQVIPTAWAEAAQARWKPLHEMRAAMPRHERLAMDSLGVDVARGGKDKTVISPRYGWYYDKLIKRDGTDTPNGDAVAGLVLAEKKDDAVVHIDVIGVGASPYDALVRLKQQVVGINVSNTATSLDATGQMRFFNLRSQLWWQMREALDPQRCCMIALPPDDQLLADLTAPRWSLSTGSIKVEAKDETKKRIGRSPDNADSVILARIETPKNAVIRSQHEQQQTYNPYK